MKKQSVFKLASILGIAATAFALSAAHAATVVTLAPSVPNGQYQDAVIDGSTTPNSGSSYFRLITGYGTTSYLLQFNGVAAIPGQTVTSATVSLNYYFPSNVGINPAAINVYQVTSSWVNGATWFDRGGGLGLWTTAGSDYNPTSLASMNVTTPPVNYTILNFDVTALVNSWVAGTTANDGLLFQLTSSGGYPNGTYGYYIMGSNKAAVWGASYIVPTLTYTYSASAVPEPSTWALLGLGAVAIFGIRRKTKLA